MNIRYVKEIAAAALIAAALGAATSSQAHHAFSAEFDSRKAIAVQGVVTKVRFVNPHSWVYLDVKDSKGAVTNWGFEFGTPNTLRNNGLGREDIKPGTGLAIQGYLAKNGGPFGYSALVTLPDGRKVKTGSAPDGPGPQ
jgi:hypothetical protein